MNNIGNLDSEKPVVSILSTPEGLYFNVEDQKVGPFLNLDDADATETAEKLRVDLGAILRAKLKYSGQVGPTKFRPEDTAEMASDIGDTFTYTGDRSFGGRAQVTALGRPQSRYMKLSFKCGREDNPTCNGCPLDKSIQMDFTSEDMDPSAFASYFDTNSPKDALRILTERSLRPNCMAWLKSARIKGEDERAVTVAIVIDRQGTEGRA